MNEWDEYIISNTARILTHLSEHENTLIILAFLMQFPPRTALTGGIQWTCSFQGFTQNINSVCIRHFPKSDYPFVHRLTLSPYTHSPERSLHRVGVYWGFSWSSKLPQSLASIGDCVLFVLSVWNLEDLLRMGHWWACCLCKQGDLYSWRGGASSLSEKFCRPTPAWHTGLRMTSILDLYWSFQGIL